MQEKIEKKGSKTIYNMRFRNLTDLYDYLNRNPVINREVFPSPASVTNPISFSGEPLEKSIQYCRKGYNIDFDNFLSDNKLLKEATNEYSKKKVLNRSMYVGMPQASLVASGVPDCFITCDRDNKYVVRNIYFNLAYPCYTTAEQIVNRGLATLYIIQALESKGEMVNFRVFELAQTEDEIINIEINLKKPGDTSLDIKKCYYPIRAKEFLRRVLFRVLESSQVKAIDWGSSYGTPATEEEIRSFFKVKPYDLVISAPDEMGITGDDIYEDTITLIKNLGIEKEFDIPKIKKLKQKDNRK